MRSTWLDIWNKKYSTKNALHVKAGFDNLTKEQYKKLANFSLEKIKIKPTDDILDVGCGSGAFLQEIQNYQTISGVDYSENAIKEIKKNLNGDFSCANADNLPFPNKSFSMTFCWSIFQYLESDIAAQKVLNEMTRVTRDGGTVFVGDVQDETKLDLRNNLKPKLETQRKPISSYTPNSNFYKKSFFTKFANKNNLLCTIYDEDLPELNFYIQSKWRFSVLFKLP